MPVGAIVAANTPIENWIWTQRLARMQSPRRFSFCIKSAKPSHSFALRSLPHILVDEHPVPEFHLNQSP